MTRFKLLGPKGTDEINLCGRAHHPHDDGYFHVDADYEDVAPLLHTGGFVIADDPVATHMTFTGPTTLVDVEALARTLPHGELRSQLLGAIAAVAKSAPRSTTRLIAPKGCDGFSHAGERFDVDETGFVDAPIEAVDSLTTVAGFAFAPDDPPIADDAEPASTASAPAVEVATPVASAIPRLVFSAIPTAVSLGRVPAVG